MNRLEILTDGHPLYANDLMFIQDAFKEAIKGLAGALGGSSNFILKGCGITDNGANYDVAEGWVVLGGEVYYVQAANYPASPTNLVWVIPTTDYDPASVMYADGNNKAVHQIRRAVVLPELVAMGGFGGYYATYASTQLIDYGKSWIDMTLLNSWQGGPLPVSNPGYIKEGRWVSFRGDIIQNGSLSSPEMPFFILPTEYRPAYNDYYPGVVGSGHVDNKLVDFEMGWIYVDTNGNCYAESALYNSATELSISLSKVRFRVG